MQIGIYPDINSLSHEAAQIIVRLANEATVTRGRFSIALSGGSTPKALFGLIATEPYLGQINWPSVEIFWADERCVPPDDAESNYAMTKECLKQLVAESLAALQFVQVNQGTLEMQRVFSTNGIPAFDLIQLGMGPEGHTASLFPHQPALHEQQRLVMPVSVPKPPPLRLTFTPPILNAPRHVLFLVTGSEKADAVQAVLEGPYQPDEYPAQIVRPTNGEVTWMLDTAAAGKLTQK